VLVCTEAGAIRRHDRLAVDPAEGRIDNLTQGHSYAAEKLPAHLMAMITDGGLIPHLKKRFAS
jgi:3-isopropylmalate/(R)-2-methylmalate dehydratase small subunit